MSKVRVDITVSADGYVAAPNQSVENPLGEGGASLHEWAVALKAFRELHGMEGGEVNASSAVIEESLANVGAEIMGRGKFGESWPPFFEWLTRGAVFELESLDVTAGADVAFATALLRCGTEQGLRKDPVTRLRLTIGLRTENGRRVVSHEHHSFPAAD